MYRNNDKPENPPKDFPQIILGEDNQMSEWARDLLWRHTIPYGLQWNEWLHGDGGFPQYPELPSGAKATLWDGWLCEAELWQGTDTDNIYSRTRNSWRDSLLSRRLDEDGYVETKQGVFYAHNFGWPFPYYLQDNMGQGWIFTFDRQARYYGPEELNTDDGFKYTGINRVGIEGSGLKLDLTEKMSQMEFNVQPFDTEISPYFQIRWYGDNLSENQPYLEWVCTGDGDYSPKRRMYFPSCPEASELVTQDDFEGIAFVMLPLYKHPLWKGNVEKLRVCIGNSKPGGTVTVMSAFTQSDSRHNINNVQYIKGCCAYFNATRDLGFLRQNILKMRNALAAFQHDHHTLSENVVKTDWVGHDGRSGVYFDSDGKEVHIKGRGVTSNWMDNQPYGGYDSYCTAYYYQTVKVMMSLEEMILNHPEWGIGYEYRAFDPVTLKTHLQDVKKRFNELFWDEENGRFYAGIDLFGNVHSNANIMANLEILYSGVATDEHAKSVMDWVSGVRVVEGDDAKGEEIYKYTFAPLISTKKNRDYLLWYQNPNHPFGTELQDGGCVLMVSYFDIMARIAIYGPDNAWKRMQEILRWYGDVRTEGGYREYFHSRGLILQGEGAGGCIGITAEFFESELPVCAVLFGFLGYFPQADKIVLTPDIPVELGKVEVTNIAWRNLKMNIRAQLSDKTVTVEYEGSLDTEFEAVANNGYKVKLVKKTEDI